MIDKMLDRIEVMLLKLSKDDKYRETLENEYALYRRILEALPRSDNLPDKLFSSVYSLEQRLNNYIILGKSSNPLVDISPTLSPKIVSDDEKTAFLALVKSNSSYIEGRKAKLDVLNSFLMKIDFDGSLDEVGATIRLVEREYIDLSIYSNEFEKELAKAKYHYIIRLIISNKIDEAENLAKDFSYNMVWVIYCRHKNSVHKLLDDGKATLAKALSDFITELPQDREKDIEFWKVLAQIENPEYKPNVESVTTQETQVISVPEEENVLVTNKKRGSNFLHFFNKKRMSTNTKKLKYQHYAFEMNEEMANIDIWVFKNLEMLQKDLDDLIKTLEKAYSKNSDAFSNVTLNVHEQVPSTMSTIPFRTVISRISNIALLKKIIIFGHNHYHDLPDGFLSGILYESIEFHNGSWGFGVEAFSDAPLLKKVDLSFVEVTRLEKGAFKECFYLEEVLLPRNMERYSLSEELFCGCRSLKTINWPYNISEIKEKTFMNCEKLTKLSFGGLTNITKIGKSAFEGCKQFEGLNSIDVESVGARAFYGCKSLKSFCFAKGCQVSDYAFANSGLISVDLVVSFKSTGVGIFAGSKVQKAIFSGELAIPAEMFKGCQDLTTVEISDDIAILGKEAFYGCKKLSSIIGGKEFTSIGEGCFKGCVGLKHIKLSMFATTIGAHAFEDCANLTCVVFPAIDTIEKGVFKGCSSLEEIRFGDLISNPIRTIKDSAFEGCLRLRQLSLWNGLRFIGKSAFKGTDLTILNLPDSVVEIGEEAFADCKYLKEVRISRKVKVIPSCMFSDCYNLKKVDMSNSDVIAICDLAFKGCECLLQISFGDHIRNVASNAFDNDYSISTIVVSKTIFYDLKEPRGEEVLIRFGLKDFYTFKSSTEEENTVIVTIIKNANRD